MSLKALHIIFIITAVFLALFFGFWAVAEKPVWAGISFFASAIFLFYLVWFVLKIKAAKL